MAALMDERELADLVESWNNLGHPELFSYLDFYNKLENQADVHPSDLSIILARLRKLIIERGFDPDTKKPLDGSDVPGESSSDTPFYMNPIFLGGALAVVGVILYRKFKK